MDNNIESLIQAYGDAMFECGASKESIHLYEIRWQTVLEKRSALVPAITSAPPSSTDGKTEGKVVYVVQTFLGGNWRDIEIDFPTHAEAVKRIETTSGPTRIIRREIKEEVVE